VPIEKFYNAHVRFEFRHCSAKDKNDKKLLGFAFLHLMDMDETTVKDGSHSLCLYKSEDVSRFENSAIYLAMPSKLSEVTSLEQVTLSQGFVRSAKENVTIVTKLVSTKLTQNVDLMKLLNWKSSQNSISDTLSKIMSLSGEEIVKFLQDILDALFAMFSTEDGNSTQHSGLVFHVLVSIISSLEDPKFEQFKPVLDAYISHHFAAALVYKGLLSCVRHCADLVTSTERQEPIQKCFRSLEFIFKFIIQSRQLFARATQGQNEDGFRMDVHLVFNSFNKMLSISYEIVFPAQALFLEHISSTYPYLLRELATLDLAKLVTLMFDSVAKDERLIHAKLTAILHAVNSQIFHDSESRSLILPTCCEHVKYHLVAKQELRLCCDILGDIITFLSLRKTDDLDPKRRFAGSIIHDINILVDIIMQPLIETLITMDKGILSSIVGGLVSRLLGLFQLMDEQPHFLYLWDRLGSKEAIKDFLLTTFHLFNELVTTDIYPDEWATMRIIANEILLKTLQDLARPLMTYFRDEGHFDSLPWTVYFHLTVSFVGQSTLQLEKYSLCKRQRILDNYGDMRHRMACQILSLWSHLGNLKLHFIPGMVGPFLEVTLIPEAELRKATIPLFFDLLECEYKAKGSFKQVESELIDKLDILVSENKGDEDYKHLFSSILMENLTQKDPVWRENGKAFVESVTRLLERLLDYRNVGQGEENRDKRMSCTVNLLNFYRSEKNRKEMYLRYIYKLHDLHIPAGSYTEATFMFKLQANDLSW
jgi:dedicator of cytokinesis protein 3